MQDVEPNPFAPPAEIVPSHPSPTPEAKCRHRLLTIFSVHVGSVVLGYFVARHEAFFFSGGVISEFLVMAPIAAAANLCPIAAIVTLRSASQYSVMLRLGIVVLVLLLCVLQIVSLLPLIQ